VNYSEVSPEQLVRACTATREAAAWEEFIRRFGRLIATTVLRTARAWGGATPEIIDELVQETYLKLCENDARLLRSFESRHEGAVFGYLKVVTQNLARDHFRREHSEKRGAGLESAPLESQPEPAPAAAVPHRNTPAPERAVLFAEIDVHLRAVVKGSNAARDRYVFWLYYRTGLTANAIAGLPGIMLTTKGVETLLLRVTRELRQRMCSSPERQIPEKGIQASESF